MKMKHPFSLLWKTVIALAILIIPLNLLCIMGANLIIVQARSSLEHSASLALTSQMESLDDRIEAVNMTLYTFPQTNASCINMLRQEDDWHYTIWRQETANTMQENMSLSHSADYFFFYMKEKDDILPVNSASERSVSSDDIRSLLKDSFLYDSRWHLIRFRDEPCLLWIGDNADWLSGAVIRLQPVLDNLKDLDSYETRRIFFSGSPVSKDHGQIACQVFSGHTDLSLNYQVEERDVFSGISVWNKFLVAVIFLYLLLIPVLIFLFRRHVSAPLSILNRAHRELREGNEDYRIKLLPRSREFQTAYDSFNSMAKTLQHLRLEKISQELAAKQLQLSNLQLQIRPHFLLNTMNLLYALIQKREDGSALEMILYLSDYFRYMFRFGTRLSMFDKEIDLIEKYLHIASFQHPDAFDISWQIDPSVSMVRIPPLLLHNFVENIISHSLVSGKIVHIIFFAEYDDRSVTIQIADDGRGMPLEDVSSINREDFAEEDSGQHLGIRNSVKRLKYFYGEGASLHVESELDVGTTFTIQFPYDLEDD